LVLGASLQLGAWSLEFGVFNQEHWRIIARSGSLRANEKAFEMVAKVAEGAFGFAFRCYVFPLV
jgi:hypothetical protein